MGAVRHESLALEGVWRIAAFGEALPHVSTPGNLSSDIRFLVKLRNLEKPQSKIVQVPVGEMPLLYHEAVVIDGYISQDERFQPKLRPGKGLLNYAPSNLRIFRRLATENGQLIIPPSKNGTPPADDAFNGYFLGIGQEDDPYSLIIPAAEVLRFFYATSDSFTRALFDGSILDPYANLFYDEKLDADGTGSMMLRKKVRDADARYLSRFAFSPYAMKQAKNLHLLWATRNASGDRAFVSVFPPIDFEAETEFLYRQIEVAGRTRKMITRILTCKCPPPCQRLLTGRETDQKSDQSPSNALPSSGAVEAHNDTSPDKISERPPTGQSSNSIEDPAIDDRFPAFQEIDVVPHSRDLVEGRSETAKARVKPPEPLSTGSVVPGRGTGGPVARTGISGALKGMKSGTRRPPRLAEIDTTSNELGHSAVIQRLGWMELYTQASISYRTVLEDVSAVGSVPVNVYPAEIEGRAKKWLYVDDYKTKRRFAIVAEIKHQDRRRYLLELQQYPGKQQQYSTIVFWNDHESFVSSEDIENLLLSCAIESKATLVASECPHIQWGRLMHSQAPLHETKGETAQRYLERILTAIPTTPHGRACRPTKIAATGD